MIGSAALMVAGMAGLVAVLRLWPGFDPESCEHNHGNLPRDHPHLNGHRRHPHTFMVDKDHPRWAENL
jgi:hypothetical protein